MGRLAKILARANTAMDGVETAVEKDVEKLIARTEEVHKRRELAFQRKHESLDGQVTDLAGFEADLEDFAKNDRSDGGESTKGHAYVGTSPPKL